MMPILDLLQAWFNSRQETLENLGQVTFRSQPFATDKPSLHLNIQSPSRESDLVVWSSGEAELILATDGREPIQEHHELRTNDELLGVLQRVEANFVD